MQVAPESTAEHIKLIVLRSISKFSPTPVSGRGMFRLGARTVHVRFCSVNADVPDKFKFNVNSQSLEADFELWICGGSRLWYLLPHSLAHSMYSDPEAYPDRQASRHRVVVSVDSQRDWAGYRRGGGGCSLRTHRCGVVSEVPAGR